MFSSENFIVFSFTFKSLNHFELIYVYGFREYFNYILLHVAAQFPAPLIEETIFSPLDIFVSLS